LVLQTTQPPLDALAQALTIAAPIEIHLELNNTF
jgi:hypothetical protein